MVSSFPRTALVWHLLHAGCPCAFPMGEHVQDSGSCSLFNVSDLQLFPSTKRFMVMSSINMLLLSPREVHQSECIALTVLGWASKVAVNPLPLFRTAFPFFFSNCLPPVIRNTRKWRVVSINTHLSKKLCIDSLPVFIQRNKHCTLYLTPQKANHAGLSL